MLATMRACASSWIWRILLPPLPMTDPIKRCEIKSRIDADADGFNAGVVVVVVAAPSSFVARWLLLADGTGFSRMVLATIE